MDHRSQTACSRRPCDIFFHIPKTAGQTFHNLASNQYRDGQVLDTHCGLLSRQDWQRFIERFSSRRPGSYRAVIGHMKFGIHELLPGPCRYLTFLRDPVKRFASYYYMLRRMGVIPREHRFDPGRPDWNCPSQETVARELDNGQTRALANAAWDLPFGECTEDHLQAAQANLDRHFAFVGLTEHFDLSILLLKRLCGWRWRFYVPKNVTPCRLEYRLSGEILKEVGRLNRFDRQIHAYAREGFFREARRFGFALRAEHGAYVTCNAIHRGIHHLRRPVKCWVKRMSRTESTGLILR